MKAMLIDEHKNLIWSEVEKPYPKDDEITRSTFAHPTEWSALAKNSNLRTVLRQSVPMRPRPQ